MMTMPVVWSFGVFFDLHLNIRLCKQSQGWWFETPSRPLWRHCNDTRIFHCWPDWSSKNKNKKIHRHQLQIILMSWFVYRQLHKHDKSFRWHPEKTLSTQHRSHTMLSTRTPMHIDTSNLHLLHTNDSMQSNHTHYDDIKMGVIASQITSLAIVYSTVYSGADQRQHQSFASLAFCGGNSPGTGEFPAQMVRNAENVSIWCRHHEKEQCLPTDNLPSYTPS